MKGPEVLSVHIEELQRYADNFRSDSKLIEESISKALDTLDSIDGLDEIVLMGSLNQDLATADQFTGGDGMQIDEVALEDLLS